MISKAAQLTILVKDQEAAKQFYTEQLGFAVCMDMEFGSGARYLAVAPRRDNETLFELVKATTPEQTALIGKQSADQVLIMFETDDIERAYREMKERGVSFHGEPTAVPGGKGVGFEDLYGNQFDLFQADKKTQSGFF
ncbi:VOC family protein [Alkalihalobacillus oceani]|uniref:VOC family protein n=1 Tax=Halalkalibacter oceani TaxID=1653776 RepID=UPI00203D1BA4|nr:VOC family protein [Halalkalibacter oceani]MCM3759681.1 VOC family protein [Halalkalibacter oceani]